MPNQNKANNSIEKIRNVAIIAHVDHGKTTLIDAILKQCKLFRENQDEMLQERILDSAELEKEKGITITAKNISVRYKGCKINIIDTPGHSDFSGEVERTLNMADGCILLVDAQEGPRAQTKFVLKKAFELNLKPIVVINKIDKKLANVKKTLAEIQDLFLDLASSDQQLDFPVFYAIGREGKVFREIPSGDLTVANSTKGDVFPLLDEIIDSIPSPSVDTNKPLQMQICSIELDVNLGKFLIGKITNGQVKKDDNVVIVNDENAVTHKGKVKKVFVKEGLEYKEIESAAAGEIAAITGIDANSIGATICLANHIEKLPSIKISPPSLKIKIEPSSSPLVGKDGKFVTAKMLEQRLEKESEMNITLTIEKKDGSSYYISGRGELQLALFIERLRREGYEFQVSKPEVIFKEENGKKYEPKEELFIETQEEYIGTITKALTERSAELINMQTLGENVQFSYKILTRNLIGLRNQLLTTTKGHVVMSNCLDEYVEVKETPKIYRQGALVSMETGISKGYALNSIQERGELFIGPGEDVYEGMIVGINKYEKDLDVNPIKERHKSAHRVKHDEITQTKLKPVIPLTLEYAITFLADDEVLEVTPHHLRLRKLYLKKTERIWSKRENLTDYAKRQMEKR